MGRQRPKRPKLTQPVDFRQQIIPRNHLQGGISRIRPAVRLIRPDGGPGRCRALSWLGACTWVEARRLQDGPIRTLRMTEAMMVPLVSSKTNPQPSSRLRLQDDSEILEADDFESLRVQLRERYPDDAFECTIHWERDLQAEERRQRAQHSPARQMAEAIVEEAQRDEKGSL